MAPSFWIEIHRHRRRWWFGYRIVYFVCTEFGYLGPYDCKEEAHAIMAYYRRHTT